MKRHALAPPTVMIATLILAFGFAFAPGFLAAQGTATPSAAEGQNHPAHIHDGTCADLGAPAFPLENLTSATDMVATPEASTPMPMASAIVDDSAEANSATSTSTVDASIDELLGSDHAINVHMSPEKADVFIACGDVSGSEIDGNLDIELNEVDQSGYSGHAELHDNGDGTTTVVVTVMEGGISATPAASPAS